MKISNPRALLLAAAALMAGPAIPTHRSGRGKQGRNRHPKRNPAGTKLWRKTQRGGLV